MVLESQRNPPKNIFQEKSETSFYSRERQGMEIANGRFLWETSFSFMSLFSHILNSKEGMEAKLSYESPKTRITVGWETNFRVH